MNELEVCQKAGPPATIEELSKFLLIAPERVTAMQAEIRAIKKAGLAAEVYLQKKREQQQLCELVLDASVRMGDIAKTVQKAPAGRPPQIVDSDDHNFLQHTKGKLETFADLGFSPKQVQRFETLANNKDLVELEKAKARAEGRMPTRTNVIDMAQARKKLCERDLERIDTDGKYAKAFVHAVHAPLMIADDLDDVAAAVWRNASGDVSGDIRDIDLAIQALTIIRAKLMKGCSLYGSFKNHY